MPEPATNGCIRKLTAQKRRYMLNVQVDKGPTNVKRTQTYRLHADCVMKPYGTNYRGCEVY